MANGRSFFGHHLLWSKRCQRQEGEGLGVDKEFMQTLAKGLAVLRAFGERPAMTLSEAAEAAELTRATARRILRTLNELGYVDMKGREFSLTPRVLELGFGFFATQSWLERAEPVIKRLRDRLQETCSASILQGTEIVHVLRAPAQRIMSASGAIGARLPAFHTAMGRIQLGYLDEEEVWKRLKSITVAPYTMNSIIDLKALVERIRSDREQGFSIVDEELEKGLRSIAVPLVSRSGRIVAAIDVSAHSNRTTRNEMREKILPELRETTREIGENLA
jgi:IclR family pca regulon transcriptional regulator